MEIFFTMEKVVNTTTTPSKNNTFHCDYYFTTFWVTFYNPSGFKVPETPAEQELPRLQSRMMPIDYRKLDNPKSKLSSPWSTSQSPVPSQNINRLTESSKAKNRSQEQANFALESLYKNILENIEYSFNASNADNPKTVEETLGGSDAKQWKKAMETEMETISKMGTWDLEELPKDWETIGNKWVSLRKWDEKGNIGHYKARLVAQGFQKTGTNFSNDGTFTLVMWFKMLRTLLALGAMNNWKIQQFNIKGAYLHGTLKKQFACGNQKDSMTNQDMYAAHQTIIQIKTIPKCMEWGIYLTNEISRVHSIKTDYCCFIWREEESFSVMMVWVNGILSFSTTDARNNWIEADLRSRFEVKYYLAN